MLLDREHFIALIVPFENLCESMEGWATRWTENVAAVISNVLLSVTNPDETSRIGGSCPSADPVVYLVLYDHSREK
jgi:hypothetical protein